MRPPAHAAAMADVAAVNPTPSRDTHHRPPKILVGIGVALYDNRCRPIVVVRSILADLMIVHIRPGYSHQHTRIRASAPDDSKLPSRIVAATAAVSRQRCVAATAPRSPRGDCRARAARPRGRDPVGNRMNSRRITSGMDFPAYVDHVRHHRPACGGPHTRLAFPL